MLWTILVIILVLYLINLLPTQIDFFYRTGIFASAVSIACFGE